MSKGRRMGDCVRCYRQKLIQARGLCDTCYSVVRRNGTIFTYELTPRAPEGTGSLYCSCAQPVVESLKWFRGEYCGACGRPFRTTATH
jgi:predicted nucleic acid-binding Zn ribbon protein